MLRIQFYIVITCLSLATIAFKASSSLVQYSSSIHDSVKEKMINTTIFAHILVVCALIASIATIKLVKGPYIPVPYMAIISTILGYILGMVLYTI